MRRFEYKREFARDSKLPEVLELEGCKGWEAYHLDICTAKAENDYGEYVLTKMMDIYFKRELTK